MLQQSYQFPLNIIESCWMQII